MESGCEIWTAYDVKTHANADWVIWAMNADRKILILTLARQPARKCSRPLLLLDGTCIAYLEFDEPPRAVPLHAVRRGQRLGTRPPRPAGGRAARPVAGTGGAGQFQTRAGPDWSCLGPAESARAPPASWHTEPRAGTNLGPDVVDEAST